MENAIKIIANCIAENNLTEAQIIKELEFLVQLAKRKQSTNFVDQLDRDFNAKPVYNPTMMMGDIIHFNHEGKKLHGSLAGTWSKGFVVEDEKGNYFRVDTRDVLYRGSTSTSVKLN